jgi:drug/metabolite transporter (DMT)-like permease
MVPVPLWILTGAIAVGTRAVMGPYQKRLLSDASEPEVLFVRDTVALRLFLPVVAWTAATYGFSGTPRSTVAMLLTGVLNVVGTFMMFAALSREDASVIIPLTSLSPIVTSLVEPLLRDTPVTPLVVAGAVLSACGAAVVNSERNSLRSVLHASDTTAVALALSVNLVFGVMSTLDGIATATVSPLYVSAVIVLFVGLGAQVDCGRVGPTAGQSGAGSFWHSTESTRGLSASCSLAVSLQRCSPSAQPRAQPRQRFCSGRTLSWS